MYCGKVREHQLVETAPEVGTAWTGPDRAQVFKRVAYLLGFGAGLVEANSLDDELPQEELDPAAPEVWYNNRA